MIIHLALVFQMLESAIHRINHYPVESIRETNCIIHWIDFYPVDSAIQRLNNQGQECLSYILLNFMKLANGKQNICRYAMSLPD